MSCFEGGFRSEGGAEPTGHRPSVSHSSLEAEGDKDLKRRVRVMKATKRAGRSRKFSGERSIMGDTDWADRYG